MILKGKVTADHGIQNYSTRPDVCPKPMVSLSSDHFWGGIAWTSTGSLELLVLLVEVAEAEVDELDVVVVVE